MLLNSKQMNKLELKIPPPALWLVMNVLMWWLATTLLSFGFSFFGQKLVADVIAVAGVAIAFAGVAAIRRARTTISPLSPGKTSTLVVSGIYRFTRNPMYLGLLLVQFAWALYLGNYAALVFPILFVLYMNRFQIWPEERILTGKFGAAFTAYCAKVRRW